MKKRMLCFAAAVYMMVPFSAITALAEKPSDLSWELEETVVPDHEVSMINGFGEFDIQDHYLYLTEDEKWDEEKLIAQMPETLEVYLDNASETVSIPVSWYCVGDNFDTDLYYYQFSPCFDQKLYKLNPSIDLLKDAPYIGVFVRENKNYQSYALDNASAGKGVTGIANETRIFEYLTKEKGINVAAACGILVNLYVESSFIPNNLQDSFEKILGYTDATYTAAVDSGEYTNFTGDSAGYGICQWSGSSRKSKLLAYAKSRGTSIADLEMQLDFMMEEVKSYSTVYRHITTAELTGDGAYDVAYYWCYYYEVPANKETKAVSRGNLAKDTYWEYYKQFIDYKELEPGDSIAEDGYTGLTEYNNELYYAQDGVWDASYTGFVVYDDNCYYVQNGYVDQSRTGFVEQDGITYYIEGGRTKPEYTGIVYFENKGYYLVDGIWESDFSSLVLDNGIWYYIENGMLAEDYTGLVKYYSTWYYVERGVLNWNYTGLTQYYSTWYYVEKGRLNWAYTGLTKYYSTWYYVEKGRLNWAYTGLTKYYSTWYYVEKGVLNWNYIGLTQYYSTWYYVEKGVLNWSYTGLAENENGWWYCVNGKVDFSYSGTVSYNGQKWSVVNGKATVISETDLYSEISDIKKAELYWVTANTLNVRSGAGTGYEKLGTTSRWDKYIVIEKKDNWGRIIYNGKFAWISLDYATTQTPFPEYPVYFNRMVETDINYTVAHQSANTFGELGNSPEAYEASALAGCFGIEGDFDRGYIMSHFGEYGTCAVSDYLDICKKYNKLAVVDMKDCTQSDVTRLVETVIAKDMLNQVVFQSSGLNKFALLENASKANNNCYLRTWYLAASATKVEELGGTSSGYVHYSDFNRYHIECVNMNRGVPDAEDIIGIQKTGTAVCLYSYYKSEVPIAAGLGANLIMVNNWN